jgi:hypothetical protein
MTTLTMILALVALAGVVVAKIVTMELLAAHHRRYARLQESLDEARSNLRAELTKHARVEREWRSVEHKRHRLNVRLARAREELDLFEFDSSCRAAHFDLLTMHRVDR